MLRQRSALIDIHGERELRELQAAAMQRVDALEKAVKKSDDEYRFEEATITRKRLRLWRGEDGDPGILDRIDDQMSLYEPAFTETVRAPKAQADIEDELDRQLEEDRRDFEASTTTPEQRQEEILIHEPATGDLFRDTVRIASEEACRKALEIVEGLEGNKGREEAIRKRLAVLSGSPEGRYDLTDARKRGIEALARSFDLTAALSSRTEVSESAAKISKKVSEWLIEEGLAETITEEDAELVMLTEKGFLLANELGFLNDEERDPEAVDPSDDDLSAEATLEGESGDEGVAEEDEADEEDEDGFDPDEAGDADEALEPVPSYDLDDDELLF